MAILLYLFIVSIFAIISLKDNDGKLIYALDDAYIHMAIAKNMALNQTWGFSDGNFASASSSPLWTALISLLFAIFGIKEIIPFILNIIFGILAIISLYNCAKIEHFRDKDIWYMLFLSVIIIPLPVITMLGMEHNLHIMLSIIFIHRASLMLLDLHKSENGDVWPFIIAPLLVGARYEGLFMVMAVFLVLIYMKRFGRAFLLLLLGFIPIIVMGIIAKSNGWHFLPTSLVIKGNTGNFDSFKNIAKLFVNFLYQPFKFPYVLPIIGWNIAVFIFLIKNKKKLFALGTILTGLFILTFFAHSHVSRFGWLYRYEAYLYAIGIFVFFNSYRQAFGFIKGSITRKIVIIVAFVLTIGLIGFRTIDSYRIVSRAPHTIYRQQYQIGKFIERFYEGETIVVNDIGAPSFLAEFQLIDPYGLGTKELAIPVAERQDRHMDTIRCFIENEKPQIAIIYEFFHVDSSWIKCGSWVSPQNEICADDSILVFAIDSSKAERLIRNFMEFRRNMPAGVETRVPVRH
ncbi:MAG: hypothetical protein ACLFSQ_01200 [Candidatus Zixiibacteriota bacterium]